MNGLAQFKIVASSLVLFVVVVFINAAFSIANVEKPYAEALLARYEHLQISLQEYLRNDYAEHRVLVQSEGSRAAIENMQRTLVRALPRTDLRLPTMTEGEDESNINVYLFDDKDMLVYTTNTLHGSSRLPTGSLEDDELKNHKQSLLIRSRYSKHGMNYYLDLPILDMQGQFVSRLVTEIPSKYLTPSPIATLKSHAKLVSVILISSIIGLTLFVILALRTRARDDKAGASRSHSIFAIALLVFVTQLTTFALISVGFHSDLVNLSRERIDHRSKVLKTQMEQRLRNGESLERSSHVRKQLGEMLKLHPEISHITIATTHGLPLYTVRAPSSDGTAATELSRFIQNIMRDSTGDSQYGIRYPLQHDRESYNSVLAIGMSQSFFLNKIADVAANGFTVIAISILIFIELLILQRVFVEASVNSAKQETRSNYGYMRPAIFIFLFGMDSSLSFLPLHMENLYQPFFGLSKDFLVGLPITVEFLFVGVAILVSGAWFDRRGWRRPFLGGLVLAAGGSVYSAIAPDAIQFVLSRAVVGAGFGLALMAAQGFIIAHTHERNKTQGLAHMFAGLYAGSICGGAAGAMLAEYYGYTFVFLLGAGVIALAIAYTLYFMSAPDQSDAESQVKISQPFRAIDLRDFLLNRNVLSLVFFSSLPAAIAVVGFLNYFSPIYLNRMGASESTIGQILIIYGTCLILAGPTIGKFVDASNDKRSWIFVGCLLGSASFLVFSFLDGVAATMLAILLLGLSSSFVLSSQTAFALQLAVTKELGQGKAIAIFRSTSRAGQALGPIVFATMIGMMGMRDGIVALGIFYLVAATMFLLVTQRDKQLRAQGDTA